MSKIDVYSTGGGSAWVSNSDPQDGEEITIYAVPVTGATLDDMVAYDIGGYPVALYVQEEQTFIWQDVYGKLSIYVTFSEPKIHIYVDGDGAANVSTEYPIAGETVILDCIPDMGQRVSKIIGCDENGNLIRFRRKKAQSFTWNYQTLDIYVTFKRRIPHRMPIEMYPIYNR